MLNIETTYINDNGRELVIIHVDNPHIDSNTLCGLDYSGDYQDNVVYSSSYTTKKINCDRCISMINYAKSFKKSQISKTELCVDDIYED